MYGNGNSYFYLTYRFVSAIFQVPNTNRLALVRIYDVEYQSGNWIIKYTVQEIIFNYIAGSWIVNITFIISRTNLH